MNSILNIIKRFDDFEKKFDKISKRESRKEKRNYPISNKGAAQRYADNVARELKRVKK